MTGNGKTAGFFPERRKREIFLFRFRCDRKEKAGSIFEHENTCCFIARIDGHTKRLTDLDNINLVIPVLRFLAWVNFYYCSAALIQRWSKMARKWASQLVYLNPWDTLYLYLHYRTNYWYTIIVAKLPSISSTLYALVFRTNIILAAFFTYT